MSTSILRLLTGGAGLAAAAHLTPSVVALGQWGPWEALPADLCRWRGPAAGAVALTFDDGPDPEGTPAVLDRLDALGMKGTFFMVGSRVDEHRDLVTEVVRRGHQVAVHGFHHRHHLWRTPRWVVADLRSAVAAMERCEVHASWYRPAFGQASGATLLVAKALGLRTVLWSAWGREWVETTPRAVARRVCRRIAPGAIVLLHDSDAYGPRGMWRIALEALDAVADRITSAGLRAVTLDRLVAG